MARNQQLPLSLASYPDDALVGADVVARVLGVSVRQVGRIRSLPYVRVSRRVKRHPVGELRRWIAARVHNRTAAA